MQRILQVFAQPSGIDGALLGIAGRTRTKGSLGQFSPTALDRSDAWDFVLAIEGAQVLAGAATRRLESRDNEGLAFPFHVRAASAPSLAEGEDGHGEIWLPRWTRSSSFREVRRLFAEGRAKTGARSAASGLDFARSVASLGVDRGVSEFVRISFQPRNGKNHFATALGRIASQNARALRLLDDVDAWLQRFRQKASGNNVPARVALAGRRLEQALFEAVGGGSLGTVLIELGNAELALGRSLAFAAKAFLNPLPRLQAAWTDVVADGSVEQRLGAALASRWRMRGRLLPLDATGRFGRNDQEGFVFVDRPFFDKLHALLKREDDEESQGHSLPDAPRLAR
jgi:CRISPR-associated protein Csx17